MEQNGSRVIRQNNVKQKMSRVCYFLIKRNKLLEQPDEFHLVVPYSDFGKAFDPLDHIAFYPLNHVQFWNQR